MYLGVLAGVLKQILLRALKARAAIFAIHTLGPWPPPMGPHGGISGVLVIGYWLLPVPTVRFERPVPPVRFHLVPVLGSQLGS